MNHTRTARYCQSVTKTTLKVKWKNLKFDPRHPKTPEPKRRRFVQRCAFWGFQNKILHFDSIFTKKTQIFGRFSTGLVDFRPDLENFGSKRALTWGLCQ